MLTFKLRSGRWAVTVPLPVVWVLSAWPVMLLLGALHHGPAPAVPALSYGWTALIMLVAQLVQWLHSTTTQSGD